MELIIRLKNFQDYLLEIPSLIEYKNYYIQEIISDIQKKSDNPIEQAKIAFEIVRDEVKHSFDTKEPVVLISGVETLQQHNGICFAKSHALATLLRGLGIPTGFCYQRVLRNGSDPESGFALHGLNAVYFDSNGWARIDPRGNKPGIDSQFNLETEQLAYPIRTELGEIDYPDVFASPLTSVIESMKLSETTQDLFYNRPDQI